MRTGKNETKEKPAGTYNLREVLAQVGDQEGELVFKGCAAHQPPPLPRQRDGAARVATGAAYVPAASKSLSALVRRGAIPLVAPGASAAADTTPQVGQIALRSRTVVPPKGAMIAASAACAGIGAIAFANLLGPSKSDAPAVSLPRPAITTEAPGERAAGIASGPLVSTLVSLSKTVLAGYSLNSPPVSYQADGTILHGPPLQLTDLIQLRASNVVAGGSGAEVSWRIEFAADGIEFPNARILIEGLPQAAKLNHGFLRTDGRWTLSAGELPGLTVTVPSAFARTQIAIILANDSDREIARTETIIEQVPLPEAAAVPHQNDAEIQSKFNLFIEKWKANKGRDRLSPAERTALFTEFRTYLGEPGPDGAAAKAR